jgi:hypothetical protein
MRGGTGCLVVGLSGRDGRGPTLPRPPAAEWCLADLAGAERLSDALATLARTHGAAHPGAPGLPVFLVCDAFLRSGSEEELRSLSGLVAAVADLSCEPNGDPRSPGAHSAVRVVRWRVEPGTEAAWADLFAEPGLADPQDALAVRALARRTGPLLLEGPVGAGKTYLAGVLARVLYDEHADHGWQRRAAVVRNFAHVRLDDLDANLRGVAQAAYTGVAPRAGWLAEADGGVLLLDDFQEAPVPVQSRLLDLLSATSDVVSVGRAGASAAEQTHRRVRFVLGVNEPVKWLVAASRLRRDLLSRVRSYHCLPALAGRDDASLARLVHVLLAKHHVPLERLASTRTEGADAAAPGPRSWLRHLSPDALAVLRTPSLPDNVRGLDKLLLDLVESDPCGTAPFSASDVVRALGARPGGPGPPQVGAPADELRRLLLARDSAGVAALLGPLDACAVDTLLRALVVAVGDRSGWNVGRMRADGALAPLASSYDGLRGLVQRFRPPPPRFAQTHATRPPETGRGSRNRTRNRVTAAPLKLPVPWHTACVSDNPVVFFEP